MDRTVQIAANFFAQQMGFAVEPIPTTDEPRADLRASDGETMYTIEVKDKIDTGHHSHFSTVSLSDEVAVSIRGDQHSRLNRLDGLLQDASKQIAHTPGSNESLNLIWFSAEGPNAEMLARRLLYTFFGIADLVPDSPQLTGLPCYYFDYNSSHKLKNVNGIIIRENDGLQIAVNEFANGVERFRRCRLVTIFDKAVYDPQRIESDETAIVLRSSVSRKHESEVLAEVKRQTGVSYRRANLTRYTYGGMTT